MKTCTKCGIEKELTEFGVRKDSIDGLRKECKCCIKNYNKKYQLKNKDRIKKVQKNYQINNRQKVRNMKKQWNENNKEKMQEYMISYRKENKIKIRQKAKEWRKNEISTNAEFKLKFNISSLFRNQINNCAENKKTKPFFKYTGLNYIKYIEHFKTTQPEEFNLYLQEGAYHIDHIIPCALYDFNDPEQIKKCWHPHNLRIIPAEENLSKSNKLDLQLVDKYNIRHLLPKN